MYMTTNNSFKIKCKLIFFPHNNIQMGFKKPPYSSYSVTHPYIHWHWNKGGKILIYVYIELDYMVVELYISIVSRKAKQKKKSMKKDCFDLSKWNELPI